MAIKIFNDNPDKTTITYIQALNIVSKHIREDSIRVSLNKLRDEFSKNGIIISKNILSRIKNKSLLNDCPNIITKLLLYYGYDNVTQQKKILYTFDMKTKKSSINEKDQS